jgi:hypothetical protein
MHLKSAIIVKQTIEQVTKLFYEPTSLAKWDRSVAEMIPGSSDTDKTGATFDQLQ